MKQIFDIFAFTYKTNVRKKAFIVTTIIMLAAVLILCSLPRILLAFTGGDVDSLAQGTFYSCVIIDETGMFTGCETQLFEEIPDTHFTISDASELETIEKKLQSDAKLALIHITSGENNAPRIRLLAKDFLNGVVAKVDTVNTVLSRVYAVRVMTDAGVDPSMIEVSQIELSCEVSTEGGLTISGYAIGILLITLTFFAVYYYGYGVAASVASEKSTRVMETLVVSSKPSRILIGKIFGMGAVGLTQFGGVILFAILCWTLLIPKDFAIMGTPITLSAFTPKSAILILLFFILGYGLYAVMNAVSGATVDKIEDLNTAMMPVMVISMGAFYLSYFTAIMGTTYDYLVNISMYIPFSAPFIMPFVLLNGEVSDWQILLSLASLILTIVLIAAIGIRIYTASVMHYGKRLKIKDAMKRK